MGEYSPPKNGMESERNLSLKIYTVNPERSLENHKIFHTEKKKKPDTVSNSLNWENS